MSVSGFKGNDAMTEQSLIERLGREEASRFRIACIQGDPGFMAGIREALDEYLRGEKPVSAKDLKRKNAGS